MISGIGDNEALYYGKEISKISGSIPDGNPTRIEWFFEMYNQIERL